MLIDVGKKCILTSVFFWDVDSRSNGKRTILLQISNNKKDVGLLGFPDRK